VALLIVVTGTDVMKWSRYVVAATVYDGQQVTFVNTICRQQRIQSDLLVLKRRHKAKRIGCKD
jgi:hypothetical protein